MYAIEVNQLSKKYQIGSKTSALSLLKSKPTIKEFWALKNISFKVKPGEIVGLIGRNGAGKSTLLKILTRITPPTGGKAVLVGRVSSLLEVGTGFHPELTGRENIFLNGAILGMKDKEIKRKLEEIVSFAEVEKFLDTPVKHYSSGMYTRLAFAIAANLQPEILLIDEVLAVGDIQFQRKSLGKMNEVAKTGRTVLFVSHNMGMIKQLCPRAILLSNGMIEEDGPSSKVISKYLKSGTSGSRSTLSWPKSERPGDENAVLEQIKLCNSSGKVQSHFGTDEEIIVMANYEILQKLYRFRLGFSVSTADGTYVFYSSESDKLESAKESRMPGHYLSICKIPANLLNTGSYILNVSGGMFGIKEIFTGIPALTFTIESTGGPTSIYQENRRGVIAPVLNWTYKKL